MPKLKNYTTEVPASRSVQEIQDMLAHAGASAMMLEYAPQHLRDRERDIAVVSAISFRLAVEGKPLSFRLPARWQAVHRKLIEQKVSGTSDAKAYRVAWRIVRDWVAAQMALIEVGLSEVPEVFLPYLIVSNSGKTLFDDFKEHRLPLIEGAKNNNS